MVSQTNSTDTNLHFSYPKGPCSPLTNAPIKGRRPNLAINQVGGYRHAVGQFLETISLWFELNDLRWFPRLVVMTTYMAALQAWAPQTFARTISPIVKIGAHLFRGGKFFKASMAQSALDPTSLRLCLSYWRFALRRWSNTFDQFQLRLRSCFTRDFTSCKGIYPTFVLILHLFIFILDTRSFHELKVL